MIPIHALARLGSFPSTEPLGPSAPLPATTLHRVDRQFLAPLQ